MIKKVLTGAVVGAAVLAGVAGPASAHQHSIVTPGGNVVTLPCEPFHGSAPGESEHSANWDAVRGLHPLHWGLHKSPSEEERQIMVVVSAQHCP
ncbi:MAG: hypothetical protein AVDCRST_MAG76-2475 [uncultured Acidimicrobiales bacterium]|uniref:Uncharacterized protein n=1 Tax=uncultured Acidimicrobiales bacterium TaxID=310071 RepID=A0A6J4IJL8_9ACTN|nr:MAG: hypothetical protein AVDCRST_MAG76-2475 [uncultured Acidimicrobiales bacterium]